MIYKHRIFVVILLGLITYSYVKAFSDPNTGKHCQQQKTTKIASTSTYPNLLSKTTTTLNKECTFVGCIDQGSYCICANQQNNSTIWPLPKLNTCPSIGCSLAGKYCHCHGPPPDYACLCDGNVIIQCNKDECASPGGCYCYFGDKVIKTSYMPASNNCSDWLREIGHQNGRFQCSAISCNCDQFGDCVCKPPKIIKNPPLQIHEQCDSKKCQKRSFEYCQCEYWDCSNGSCIKSRVFKNLPKSGICSGMLNSSYQCENVGQKCSCKSDCDGTKTQNKGNSTKTSECVCVDIDPIYSSNDCISCDSHGSCICTYGEFAVRIPNSPNNCKALEKSQTPSTTTFDACPYREGQDCECKRNPNTGQKQCSCKDGLKRIPPFNLRTHPHKCCNGDSDCIEHSELYCYCTNYANNTYVKKVERSAISKLSEQSIRNKNNIEEKLCYAYGLPPDISCHTFGYTASCVLGFCKLNQIKLYYTTFKIFP